MLIGFNTVPPKFCEILMASFYIHVGTSDNVFCFELFWLIFPIEGGYMLDLDKYMVIHI